MAKSTSQSNTNRNRLLYGVLIVVVSLYFFDIGYRRMYEEPVRQSENRIDALRKQIQNKKVDLAKAKKSTDILPKLQQRALPYQLEPARSSYQAWLLALGKQTKIQSLKVDSGEPTTHTAKKQVLYQSIPFSFRGRGNMRQVTSLLHDFYEAGHLHKIRTMALTPIGGSEFVDITLAIDTIALPTADRETELTELPSDRLASPSVDDYRAIAQRNLFQAGGYGVGRHLKLSAVTSNSRGILEAWFQDTRSERTYRLKQGEQLEVGSLIAQVAEIEKKSVGITIDGQQWPVKIGQSLSEAQALASQTAATD